jgi:hypothetical protein
MTVTRNPPDILKSMEAVEPRQHVIEILRLACNSANPKMSKTVFSAANECRQLETVDSVDELFDAVSFETLKEIYLTGTHFQRRQRQPLVVIYQSPRSAGAIHRIDIVAILYSDTQIVCLMTILPNQLTRC